MAFDAFLIFNAGSGKGTAAKDAPGETQDSHYKKEQAIEISEFSFGAENVATIGSKSGGAGSGKANFKTFTFKKTFDTATTGLFQTMCQGGHYEDVRLELRKAGGASGKYGDPYAKFKMSMVFITSVEYSANEGDAVPTELVSFAFGAIAMKYHTQDNTGKLGPALEAQWSQVLNKAVDKVS